MRRALELAAVDPARHSAALRAENLDVLSSICPEPEAIAFFVEFSFAETVEIGQFRYHAVNELKKEYTWEDSFQYALTNNLLIVGSCINGDLVVVDLADYQVGIIFHDYFWENEEEDPRKYLVKMECSLGQFFLNSASLEDYPIDAYEAAAYMGSAFTGYWSPEDDAQRGEIE